VVVVSQMATVYKSRLIEKIGTLDRQNTVQIVNNSIHKPPALPVRIEKVLPLPGDYGTLI